MVKRRRKSKPVPAMTRGQWISAAVAVLLFLVPCIVTFPGLSVAGHRVLSIFLLAVVLWVTEAIPLHATAMLVIFLQILTISDKGVLSLPESFSPIKYGVFYGALASPILMLFLGGFFLSVGASKYALDRNLARVLLRPFGTSPQMVVLGLMLITAVFSMFMSNTATTATMMAVVLPIIASLPPGERLRTGLALSIPVAANLGGMGTPIGTPPNAIAMGALMNLDPSVSISFGQWMLMVVPLIVVVLALGWFLICLVFKGEVKSIELSIDSRFDTSRPAIIFYATFAITIILWLTESFHGVKSTVVGFVPVVVLLVTRVFTTEDIKKIQWHVLWLVAGGIALGIGVGGTGLDAWLIGSISWDQMSPLVLLAILGGVALVFSTFISNSATANLLIPIGLSMCASGTIDEHPILIAVIVAVGCSLAMALPISTPPNAIALSSGAVRTKDLAIVGVALGGFGWLLFTLVGPPYWQLLGVIP